MLHPVAVALLALQSAAATSTPTPARQRADTVQMSFAEAIQRARAANPGFVRDSLSFDNSMIDLASARAQRYLPRLSLDFTVPEYVSRIERRVDEDGTRFDRMERRTLSSSLDLEQPLPTGGSLRMSASIEGVGQPTRDADERYSGVSFLGFEVEQQIFGINRSVRDYRLRRESFARASAGFIDDERELSGDVMDAYYGLVQALKQAQIDSVLYVRDSLRNAAAPDRQRQQSTSGVDSLKFEIEAIRSAINLTESSDDLNAARLDLNHLLALPNGTIIVPDTVIVVERFEPNVEDGLALARANRQDLRLAQLAVENRDAGLRDARRTSPVTLFVNSTIGFDGSSESFSADRALLDAIDNQDRSRTINLGVRIPLFDRFAETHAVARAENDLRAAQISLDDQQRRLEDEVRDAARSVNIAARRLDLTERQFALTSRALELQRLRYAAGEITLVELLIDQANARESEIALLEAKVDMLRETEDWKRAIGDTSGYGR